MNGEFVPFDDTRKRAAKALEGAKIPGGVAIYLVRNLFGKVRISVSDRFEGDDARCADLRRLAGRLSAELGAHGHPPERGVLFVSDDLLETLRRTAQPVEGFASVFWEDRLVTGNDWWTVGDARAEGRAQRWTLFSVKGGVGRSTTAAVLAWHLARKGERVLVVDLDLESPGLSSAVLDPSAQPEFGVADWFVEDLVGQGGRVIEDMTAAPAWAQASDGAVRVAPAHGRKPGEYLAKLGRVHVDRADDPWIARLERLLTDLEARFEPDFVLVESRSGLHDVAAATVTDIGADVLLFATDSEIHWTGYGMLFDHWRRDRRLATAIRDRLSIVSALTPHVETEAYLQRFQERSWDLFQDRLYDSDDPADDAGEAFWFNQTDDEAPHSAMPIHWTRGLAAGTSLRNLERTTVKIAYEDFLDRFDRLAGLDDRGEDR